jgi:hypothetical protein
MNETTTERPSRLRLWLARYKPTMVRCTLKGGETRDLQKPSVARGQWANLEHAILGLAPTYLEAYQGETCVAARAGEDVEEEEQAQAPALPQDPVAAVLVAVLPTITQLIVDAGDAAASRQREAYEISFREHNLLVKMMADRLGGLERTIHKLFLDQAASVAKGVEDDNDGAALGLVKTFLQNQGNAPNGAPPKESQ